MALGLAGCGDDDGGVTTGPCLDYAPMTGTETGDPTDASTSACLDVLPMTTSGSDSGSGDSTTFGPCLDAPPMTSTGSDSSGSDSSGSDSSGGSTGVDGADERDEVVRTLVDRGILPNDVAAKLGERGSK